MNVWIHVSYFLWIKHVLRCSEQTLTKHLVELVVYGAQAYTSKRRILILVLLVSNAYTKSGDAYINFAKFFCCLNVCSWMCASLLQLDLNAYTWCTHWVSNCNAHAKCIYVWANNKRIWPNEYMHHQIWYTDWGKEVPEWVCAFWKCKPVGVCMGNIVQGDHISTNMQNSMWFWMTWLLIPNNFALTCQHANKVSCHS